jgi:hypothetical protein
MSTSTPRRERCDTLGSLGVSMADVRVYRLNREGAAQILKRRQVLTSVFFAFVVGSSLLFLTWRGYLGTRALELVLVIQVVMLVPAYAFGVRRFRAACETFGIALGPDVVRCVRLDGLAVEILRTEVTRIVEGRAGLLLRAETPARAIVVPRALDGYDDARALLITWRTPDPVSAAARRRQAGILTGGLLLLPSYLLARDETSTELALLATLLFAGLGGWILVTVGREPLFNVRLKALLFVLFGWLALSVLSRWTGVLLWWPV